MSACEHEFKMSCRIAVFDDRPGQASLEVEGSCVRCGKPVVFQGLNIGGGGHRPATSIDRHQMRAPLTIGDDVQFNPGMDFQVSVLR